MILKSLSRLRSVGVGLLRNNLATNRMAMGDTKTTVEGLSVHEIVGKLEKFAPLSLAENWDNVGLLVEPRQNEAVKGMMLTNDLTEDVIQEAVDKGCGLIVTYHPNIFHGLKTVSLRNWKERIVVSCLQNNIAVFSPHTSWDSIDGGVNDWLSSTFSFSEIRPIEVREDNPKLGAGRLIVLKEPITVEEAVASVKKHTGLSHVRLAVARNGNTESKIKSVAVCAGSGISVLRGVVADLYFTGEMLHHDILEAAQSGIHVILTNHSDSERGFLKKFQPQLQTSVLEDKVNVLVSEVDKDPLFTL